MQNANALITNTDTKLSYHLKNSIRKSKTIKIIASFIMESGVRMILQDLLYAKNMGANIQILTGYYLGITEPSALYLLKMTLGDVADIRIFKYKDISFHPKTYIFEDGSKGEVYIGSSNMSASAFEKGVEWNYRIMKDDSADIFMDFNDNFNNLFFHHSLALTDELLKEYSINWRKTKFKKDVFNSGLLGKLNDLGKSQNIGIPNSIEVVSNIGNPINLTQKDSFLVAENVTESPPYAEIVPLGAQIEALYFLKRAREEVSKGLVVMATGVGKTYLSAFDSKNYSRILFVAHREEILSQAYKSFKEVMPEKLFGMFKASSKPNDADVIFASVQTLGKSKYLTEEWFKPDYFEYIIIDEFHHIAAKSYKEIVDYFKPKFLLGLTATPFRMDNKDIFSFCDDNLIYEINLKEAIERDYLIPFNYYGIYDDTNYNEINYTNGKYDEKELEKALSTQKRANLVLKYYKMYGKKRTLAFCSSIKHANLMTEAFIKAGIASAAVHTGDGEYTEIRDKAITKLKTGELKVLFVVDIFNEGVDIPEVDTVLFLRPTESYTVFIQQLGRGLRKADDKTRVNVLDFIGNYKLAPVLPILLSGKNPMIKENRSTYEVEYPEGCNIQFDLKLMDLFEELKKHDKIQQRLENEYFRLKAQLGERPSRLDLFDGSDLPTKEFFKKGYLNFLNQYNQLTDEELAWLGSEVEDLLLELEKMNLQKLYKIPTLLSFVTEKALLEKVSAEDIGKSMQEFYKNPQYAIDMQDDSSKDYKTWSVEKFMSLAIRMPINFISKSSDYFAYDEINKNLILDIKIVNASSPVLTRHIKDILTYRLKEKCAKLFKGRNKEI